MSFNNHRFTNRGKATTKRIGIRSIYDIINNTNATDDWKINYIRHRYVYYDGNYDLFHDADGNPTETKKMLDDVIEGIIRGNLDPSELSIINKQILELRKQKKEEEELRKDHELEEYLEEQQIEEQESQKVVESVNDIRPTNENAAYKKGITGAEAYFEIIDMYLDSLSPEDRQKAETWSYKDLKRVAKWWLKNNKPNVSPVEIHENGLKRQGFGALLAGYKKYAQKEWKNTDNEETV